MKKFTLLFTFILGFGITGIQAQSHCDKSAAASCSKTCSKSAKQADSGSAEAAAKLASMDESIEGKVCEHSGNVSYSRKDVGSDGEVKFTSLTYSASANEFVAVTDSNKKSCCASGSGSGSASSANAGKTSKSASAVGCCSKKGAAKTTDASVKQKSAVDKKSSK